MKTKPFQNIKQKAFKEGYDKAFEERYITVETLLNETKEQRKLLDKQTAEIVTERAKVAALSAILQSIHTSAQAGADILRVK
jgi:hypothetical protein